MTNRGSGKGSGSRARKNVRFGSADTRGAGVFTENEFRKDGSSLNSSFSLNNKNANMSKADKEQIMLFNPINNGLSGSLTGRIF